MISTAFIMMAYQILGFFLLIFPISTGYPSEIQTAMSWIGGYLGMLDPLVPKETLLATVTIVFVVELVIFGYKLLTWIVSKIPFIGR